MYSCDIIADYSKTRSQPAFPYLVKFEPTLSDIGPLGAARRFAYVIRRSPCGAESASFIDSATFAISPEIEESSIIAANVLVNSIPQEVIIGANARIVKSNPAPGLRFDFTLAEGEARIEFSLDADYAVESAPVYLTSDGTLARGLNVCGPGRRATDGCETCGFKNMDVRVPVTVTPRATAGRARVFCEGSAQICRPPACHFSDKCDFWIRQRVCVMVPIEISATAEAGAPEVDCGLD